MTMPRLSLGLGLMGVCEVANAQMSPQQIAAFRTANNGAAAITEAQTALLAQGVASVVLLLWFAWVCKGAYQGWASRKVRAQDAGGHVIRASLVFVFVLFVVTR